MSLVIVAIREGDTWTSASISVCIAQSGQGDHKTYCLDRETRLYRHQEE